MKRIVLSLALLVAVSTGCTTVHMSTSRANFDQNARIKAACAEYASTAEMNQGVAKAAAAGWRVAETGTRTTSFLFFGSSKALLCFEKRIESPADENAQLPLPEKPRPPPREDDHDQGQQPQDDR